jgi:hypothetical protein
MGFRDAKPLQLFGPRYPLRPLERVKKAFDSTVASRFPMRRHGEAVFAEPEFSD